MSDDVETIRYGVVLSGDQWDHERFRGAIAERGGAIVAEADADRSGPDTGAIDDAVDRALTALDRGEIDDAEAALRQIQAHTTALEAALNRMTTIDIRFGSNGLSASAYNQDGSLHDEAWFTWDEVDARKDDEESNVTFEADRQVPDEGGGA